MQSSRLKEAYSALTQKAEEDLWVSDSAKCGLPYCLGDADPQVGKAFEVSDQSEEAELQPACFPWLYPCGILEQVRVTPDRNK